MSQETFYLDLKPVLPERKQSSLLSVSHDVDNQSRAATVCPNYQQCANILECTFWDKWAIQLHDGIAYFPYPICCDSHKNGCLQETDKFSSVI
jgi:hypothetical protein